MGNGKGKWVELEKRGFQAGITLVESLIALMLVMITISGLAMLNSQGLLILKNQKQTNAAGSVLQNRVEQVRNMGWEALIDPVQIRTLLNDPEQRPMGLSALGSAVETVQARPYTIPDANFPAPSGVTQYSVKRNATSGANTTTGGTLDTGVIAVQITVVVEWKEGTRNRQLSSSIVLTKTAKKGKST